MIEKMIGRRIARFISGNQNSLNKSNTVTLYHNISYGTRYDEEVNALRKIIERGVEAVEENTKNLSSGILQIPAYCFTNNA